MGQELADLVMDELDEKARSTHETDLQELAERVRQLVETEGAKELPSETDRTGRTLSTR